MKKAIKILSRILMAGMLLGGLPFIPAAGEAEAAAVNYTRNALRVEEQTQGEDGQGIDGESPAAVPVRKAAWHKNKKGWWYEFSDGSYAENGWYKIGSGWYYFDERGYMEADAYRNGYYLTKSGVWDGKRKTAGWSKDSTGWLYAAAENDRISATWMKIDGEWYYFKADGYAAANEWIRGCWLGANCMWRYKPRGSWHTNVKGWWYGDTSGWYAKGESVVIDEVEYIFTAEGYLPQVGFH